MPVGRWPAWSSPEVKTLVVEPAYRRQGIGRALVEAGVEIERERGRPNLLLGLLPEDAAGHAFVAATGFSFHSTLWDLDLDPEVAVEAPVWPEGTRPRQIDRDRGHPGVGRAVQRGIRGPRDAAAARRRPDGGGQGRGAVRRRGPPAARVGFGRAPRVLRHRAERGCRTAASSRGPRSGPSASGRSSQGRGYGRQLLRWGIGHLRDVGAETVTLSVNGRNPRALGLYESEGFHRTATRERWAHPA